VKLQAKKVSAEFAEGGRVGAPTISAARQRSPRRENPLNYGIGIQMQEGRSWTIHHFFPTHQSKRMKQEAPMRRNFDS